MLLENFFLFCAVTFDIRRNAFSDFLRESRSCFFRFKVSLCFCKPFFKPLLFRDRLVHVLTPIVLTAIEVSFSHFDFLRVMCFGCCYYIRLLDIVKRFLEKFLFLFFFALDYVLYSIPCFCFVKWIFQKISKKFFQRERPRTGLSLDVRTRQAIRCFNIDSSSIKRLYSLFLNLYKRPAALLTILRSSS